VKTYSVSFYKLGEKNEEGQRKGGGEQYLGSVSVDHHPGDTITVVAKAFRQAPTRCLMADKTVVQEDRRSKRVDSSESAAE
jgi:hypothetical protein